MSTTEVFNNTEIINANIAAFAAFQKKSSFGPATINIRDSNISESKMISLIQKGSSGFLNSKKIPTTSFLSSDLYESKK